MVTEEPMPKGTGELSVVGAVMGHAVEKQEPPCNTLWVGFKDTVE